LADSQHRITRVVALGASNLTRGLPALVSAARSAWGPGVELLLALGLGRSYGARSRVGFRSLPSILESGLWDELQRMPAAATRALMTDIGNDVLYGFSTPQILEWVTAVASRLQTLTADVVLTDLPMASLRRTSRRRLVFFRSILYPPCRLTYQEILERTEALNAGLERLAEARGLRLLRQRGEWYGFDPIHIRPLRWRDAWHEILDVPPDASHASRLEALRLYAAAPERQWLFGVERVVPQHGRPLPSGGRLWLY
jgi:hypothetical protein